jgi:hypothetical protein
MFLDIKPLEGFGWECIMGSYIAVASWWGFNYELAFNRTWFFPPHKASDTIIDSYRLLGTNQTDVNSDLSVKYSYINCELLEKYSYMKMVPNQNKIASEVLEVIKNELREKKPVLIQLDIFFCNWFQDDYHLNHSDLHFILIIGIDFETNSLHCTDCPLMFYNKTISIEDFLSGYLGIYYTFERLNNKDFLPKKADYIKMIKSSAQKMLGQIDTINRFYSMRVYADRLLDLYNISVDKVKDNDFKKTYLAADFWRTFQGRMQYSQFLKFVSEQCKNEDILELSSEMKKLSDKWIATYYLILASNKNGDFGLLKRASEKIRNISYLEEQIANKILEIK